MDLKATLKAIKLNETLISAIFGVVVIIIIGMLAINYFSKRQSGETIPSLDVSEETTLPTTHIVASGEDLWSISEKYYGTGYNWTDIAKANNMSDPNQITEGQSLAIPDVNPRFTIGEKLPTTSPKVTSVIPTAVPVAENFEGKSTHKVLKGENLWRIAEKYYQSGYNWVDIAKANNLTNTNLIEESQELIIPNVTSKKETIKPQEAAPESESISGGNYTVQKGDNLWNIAVRAYGDGYRWGEIAKENNLLHPGLIHSGNVLRLRR